MPSVKIPGLRAALTALAAAGLYIAGAVEPIETRVGDLLFRLLQRAPTDDIVVVAIDPASLQRIGVWPWPRRLHADLVDRLAGAGAAGIVFDIDFSAASTPANDAALAAALERVPGLVTLPVFRQYADLSATDAAPLVHSLPLPALRRHVRLASANMLPEPDGLIRQASAQDTWQGRLVPTLAGMLAGMANGPDRRFRIDYGIDPSRVPRISFADALAGDFDPSLVEGRQVLVAATAIELGDIAAVPVLRALPGGFVQVLAAQSLLQGRALHRSPPWLVVAGITVLSFGGGIVFRCSWRRGLAILIAGAGGVAVAAGAAYAAAPVLLDVVPWLLVLGLAYVGALVARIDEQSVRLFVQSLHLHRQNAFIRRVADHAFDGLITTDEGGRVRSFSKSASRIFGRSEAEILGQPFETLCPTGLPPAELAADRRCPCETVGLGREGERIPIEIAVTRITDDGQQLYVIVVRDIADLKQAEAEATRAQNRLADAIASSPSGFALFDDRDRLVLCNARYREFLAPVGDGLEPGTTVQRILKDYAAATGRDEAWIADRLAQRGTWDRAIEDRLIDGRWLSISGRRTSDGGTVELLTEVTEAKRREKELRHAKREAERLNRAKSDFIATISHEMRTPLNAIIGFSDLLLDDPATTGSTDYLGEIHNGAEALLAVLNDVIDLSALQAGRPPPTPSDVDVARLIRSVTRPFVGRAEAAGTTLTVRSAPGAGAVMADERLVRRALASLLDNAVKFTPSGGTIDVSTTRHPSGELAITVKDNGIGIAQEDLSVIMEAFGQADNSRSRAHGGAGLGLALARAVMELHAGTLTLASSKGEGTTAVLLFPKDDAAGKAALIGADRRRTAVA